MIIKLILVVFWNNVLVSDEDLLVVFDLTQPIPNNLDLMTALIRVLTELINVIDNGNTTNIHLRNLSTEFDTTVHSVLLHRLETSFTVSNEVLRCFETFLSKRSQVVSMGDTLSSEKKTDVWSSSGFCYWANPIYSVVYASWQDC